MPARSKNVRPRLQREVAVERKHSKKLHVDADQPIRSPRQLKCKRGRRAAFHLTPVRPYRHAIQFVNKVGKEQTAIVHAHITSIMAQRFRWRGPPVGRRYRRGSIMIACPEAMSCFESDGDRGRKRERNKGMVGR